MRELLLSTHVLEMPPQRPAPSSNPAPQCSTCWLKRMACSRQRLARSRCPPPCQAAARREKAATKRAQSWEASLRGCGDENRSVGRGLG